jgi:predicted RNA-binding Zn ribbon-like protein
MSNGVPTQLWLVESFLNSVDVSSSADDLADVDSFQRWLRDHDRGGDAPGVTAESLEWARQLRTELRGVLRHHHGDDVPVDPDALAKLTEPVRLGIGFAPHGGVFPQATGTGVARFLGEILGAIVVASIDGEWRRLKLCSASDCAVVYYDTSKNRSKRWCSMQVCGNRAKTRAYYRRRGSQRGSL